MKYKFLKYKDATTTIRDGYLLLNIRDGVADIPDNRKDLQRLALRMGGVPQVSKKKKGK